MSARGKIAGGIAGSSAALAMAINFIGGWEGSETTAYWDHFGQVWTVCSGETRGVGQGDTYSQAECDVMLAAGILDFERQLDACLTDEDSIPVNAKVAFVSWTYNVGAGAACGSTLVRKANAGDLDGAAVSCRAGTAQAGKSFVGCLTGAQSARFVLMRWGRPDAVISDGRSGCRRAGVQPLCRRSTQRSGCFAA